MATIVRYKHNEELYILLGTGYGLFKSTRPGFLGGDLFPNEETGSESKASVCDDAGRMFWGRTDDLTVVEIDGESPAAILAAARGSVG